MTPRESFIAALECKPPQGRVPHFELEFFLTMESFGRIHPSQRHYEQWDQMSESERILHRKDIADLQICVAKKYEHSGILYRSPRGWQDEDTRLSIEYAREMSGMNYLITLHGDPTYSLPNGDDMIDFSVKLAEQPQLMKDEAQRGVDQFLERAARLKKWGTIDGFCLCSDYCFNDNPFMPPAMFDEFVTPYLQQLIKGYREMGFYTIKHTDGNIMPILDSLVSTNPHALHSLDPQGGVELKEVKKRIGDKICLIGNVNCAMLQNGSNDEITADVRRALHDGMSGGGYVFSTSNCIYTGMSLENYELMLDVWRQEGVYE